jgi:hypothetical protein
VIITARQCSGGARQRRFGYLGKPGNAGTVPGTGEAVVGVGVGVELGVTVKVCGPSGPPGPSGSITVVVGVGDVGLVGLSSGGVVVVSVGSVDVVVGVSVVVVASDSFGRLTCVRGTQV